MAFNGVHMGLGNICKLSNAVTRAASPENVFGRKGRGGMAELDKPNSDVEEIGQINFLCEHGRYLGPQKWKVRPTAGVHPGDEMDFLRTDGPGVIQHLWLTIPAKHYRDMILCMYWDHEAEPSVQCPVGDFFCNGFNQYAEISALPINVNPKCGLNCYFPMPFRKHARITFKNYGKVDIPVYYTFTYTLTEVDDDEAYFHAQFRRVNPLPYKQDYVLLDGVRGQGQYVGTYMAWEPHAHCWFGEGEFKVFIDGDTEFPTICGTGAEDYFGGAYCFGEPSPHAAEIGRYSAPFLGHIGNAERRAGNRHGLYRFHIYDPIRFHSDFKATIQALGWCQQGFLPMQDDISSVAYWYQSEPHRAFPAFPTAGELEVIGYCP